MYIYIYLQFPGASIPPKPMMHIAYSPYIFTLLSKFPPIFVEFTFFLHILRFCSSPVLHHTLHVLDAPAIRMYSIFNLRNSVSSALRQKQKFRG